MKIFLKKVRRVISDDSKPKEAIHDYWKNPDDGTNTPAEYYERGHKTSEFLINKVTGFLTAEAKILEIGTNVGRNLDYLYRNQYHNLTGVEISENAVALMKKNYPEMYNNITIINKPVELAIKDIPDNEFDLIFTVAVLEHIHKDSEWIFKEMVRISKNYVLTIEDERSISWKHFPRKYNKIFTKLGMEPVEVADCRDLIHKGFYYRLFRKNKIHL